ncbi:helix-turn-helix domain-containing protein [Streptomyces sp. NPDC006527]|uniref:helix-turn-helix domain-containing protein n=1 Tax=Streptomyces sp. NPDC006527 TaxID=3364749 RepID=UPI0036CB0CCA
MTSTEFASLLRELKERSGLSYGTLAKRLHMSTSTLHRYCNGDAVPTDYAPVERLARLCKATPEELVELHRRWVLADAVRRRGAGGDGDRPGDDRSDGSRSGDGSRLGDGQGVRAGDGDGDTREASEAAPAAADTGSVSSGAEVVRAGGVSRRVRRSLLLAGVAAATALGAVALALSVPGGASERDGVRAGGAAASVQGKPEVAASASPSAAGPSASPSRSSAAPSGSASPSTAAGGRPEAAPDPADDAPPLTVATRPYAWEGPCGQRYLIDDEPGRVAPPPLEQDAPAWVAAHGAVSSGQQYLELTVQGTGDETVVVESLKVRTLGKRSPLAWNDFAMGYPGVGCGGDVPKHRFTVALDAARPALVPEAGQDHFPFKVSESDPEVYYVSADASAYDVRWVLELSWSSGSRRGTLTIDDDGEPFRTSGNNGRPAYEFPLGGSAWERAGASPTP